MRHLRMVKLCSQGARDWWKHHDLDWSDFLANGIDGQTLLDTGDPHAAAVVEAARKENVG